MFSNDPIEIFNLKSDCFSPHCQREKQLVLKRCLLEVANTMLAELYVMQRPCGAKHLWSAGKTRRVCPKRLTEVGVFAEKIKKKNSSIGKLDTHYCSGSVRGINRAVFSSSNLNANFECGFHIVEFEIRKFELNDFVGESTKFNFIRREPRKLKCLAKSAMLKVLMKNLRISEQKEKLFCRSI